MLAWKNLTMTLESPVEDLLLEITASFRRELRVSGCQWTSLLRRTAFTAMLSMHYYMSDAQLLHLLGTHFYHSVGKKKKKGSVYPATYGFKFGTTLEPQF